MSGYFTNVEEVVRTNEDNSSYNHMNLKTGEWQQPKPHYERKVEMAHNVFTPEQMEERIYHMQRREMLGLPLFDELVKGEE